MTMGPGTAYPGGKRGSGVCEKLISWMPVHRVYVAAFAGHDAIWWRKRASERSIMVDRDATVCRWWQDHAEGRVETLCCDFLDVVSEVAMGSAQLASAHTTKRDHPDLAASLPTMRPCDRTSVTTAMVDRETLLYVDPPYLRSVRSLHRLWRHEMDGEKQHRQLLRALKRLPCMVMLSGYPSDLYQRELKGWRCETYRVMTRGGPRTECAWMNYAANLPLHDCRYVGGTFRGRERLKRRCSRWVRRFVAMPPAERQMILQALTAVQGQGVSPE